MPRTFSPLTSAVLGTGDAADAHSFLHGQTYHVWENVKAHGAIGNGVADDTTAIQAAITACKTAGGGTVYFPRGVYKHTATALSITGNYNITLAGASTTASKLIQSGAASRMVELGDGTNAANDFIGKLTVKDLMFDGNGNNVNCFEVRNVAQRPGRIVFYSVWLYFFGTGYGFKNPSTDPTTAEDSSWFDTKVSNGGTGINMRIGEWTFVHCTFGFLTTGMELYGNSKVAIYSSVFTSNTQSIVFSEAGTTYTNQQLMSGGWFENDTNYPITSSNTNNVIDLVLDTVRIHHLGNGHANFDVKNSQIEFRHVDFAGLTPKVTLRSGLTTDSNILYSTATRTWNHQGKVASPFNTTRSFVGPQIHTTNTFAAAPTASTWYQVQGCRGIRVTWSGGTGVSVDIADRPRTDSTTIGATGTEYLPAGCWINFGGFSVAPTVKVWPD
jgi:hypothetical protein